MSGGRYCWCKNKKEAGHRAKNWRVINYRCNYSAFNGYHYTPSEWSAITCLACRAHWRTKAPYAAGLPRWTNEEELARIAQKK